MYSTAACPARKQNGFYAKVTALVLSGSLLLASCLSAQAFAAPTSTLAAKASLGTNGFVAAETAIAATDTTTKVLPYNVEAVAGVGTQETTGHTSCCLAFSQAIGDTMMTGETVDHMSFAQYGNCAWSPCASYGDWTEGTTDLVDVYNEINAGRPAVMFVSGHGSYQHWVVVFGYVGVEDPNAMTLDNLYVIDPWDGAVMIASERFSRGDGSTIELSAKTETVCRR